MKAMVICTGLLLAAPVPEGMAQTACPGGVAAGSAQCSPDALQSGGGYSGPPVRGLSVTAYGGHAYSEQAGQIYTVHTRQDGYSYRAIGAEALQACEAAGNTDCRPIGEWSNGCGVAAAKRVEGQVHLVHVVGRTPPESRRLIRRACNDVAGEGACERSKVYCARPRTVWVPY